MISVEKSETFEIEDRVRRLRFTGVKIGHASTRRRESQRWTEVTIFRTEGGKYIVQRQGMSLVYHRQNSSCHRGVPVENRAIQDGSVPCPDCKPPSLDQLDQIQDTDETTYLREVTISSADVTDDPRRVISALTYKGTITTVSQEAITEAMRNDPRLAKIFDEVEEIS